MQIRWRNAKKIPDIPHSCQRIKPTPRDTDTFEFQIYTCYIYIYQSIHKMDSHMLSY